MILKIIEGLQKNILNLNSFMDNLSHQYFKGSSLKKDTNKDIVRVSANRLNVENSLNKNQVELPLSKMVVTIVKREFSKIKTNQK